MLTIQYPTLNVLNFSVNPVYLSGDEASVEQYCLEKEYELENYEVEEKQRFSNDGALLYQVFIKNEDEGEGEWKTEFGFSRIVTVLNYNLPAT